MQKSVTTNFTRQLGVIADLDGLQLSAADRDFLQQPEIAGLILFARNYQSPQQLQQLTAEITALRPELLICVDQEGGRVQRFRDGFSRLPAMLTLEPVWRQQPQLARELARELGWLMAQELLDCGVHLSFAPVLDIERDCSRVIGDRAFAHDAEGVTELASAFVAGMQSLGMAAVGKHFPGHGAVVADSHLELPTDERPLTELEYDIRPFRELIRRDQLQGIMPAHVLYPALDGEHTAGFSFAWLQQKLRRELDFQGVIFSDDLSMAGAAAAGDYRQRSRRAIAAGCNALLACNDRGAAQQVIDSVAEARRQQPDLQPLNLSSLIPPRPATASPQRRRQLQQQIQSLINV